MGVVLIFSACSCSIENQKRFKNTPVLQKFYPTRASLNLKDKDIADGLFIGIALSGGGSRAANFSMAALQFLQHMGFLQRATVISSVSGSSLTAAYYGLHQDDEDMWDGKKLEETLGADFQTKWEHKMFFSPLRWWRYAFTAYNRTDTMADVFDDLLFQHATFERMNLKLPYILINATEISSHNRFTFADETFTDLGSSLYHYPISNAVIASGAFPGVFRNVTIRDYLEANSYKHLFDGGPYDNLGMNAILDVLNRYVSNVNRNSRNKTIESSAPTPQHQGITPNQYFKACLLILVDAYPENWSEGRYEEDLSRHSIIDMNFMNSFDVLLAGNRDKILEKIGLRQSSVPVKMWDINLEGSDESVTNIKQSCMVWHITFGRLKRFYPNVRHALGLWQYVNNIPTLYRLEAPPGREGFEKPRDVLYKAAELLVKDDDEALEKVCAYLIDYYNEAKAATTKFLTPLETGIFIDEYPPVLGLQYKPNHAFEGCGWGGRAYTLPDDTSTKTRK